MVLGGVARAVAWPLVAAALGIMLCASLARPAIGSASRSDSASDSDSCLGPPYLYVTFHGGAASSDLNMVHEFSRDGCDLGKPLEKPKSLSTRELRGMALTSDGRLMVANAYQEDSKVLLFDACDADGGRAYAGEVSNATVAPALVHPYAVLAPADGGVSEVLVSAQDTDSVVSLRDGTVRFQLPDASAEGVRGLAACFGLLFVADAGTGGVYVLRASDMAKVKWMSAGGPGAGLAGAVCDAATATVLVSVRDSPTVGTGVAVFNVSTLELQGVMPLPGSLTHPAGLALDESARQLYVGGHNTKSLYRLGLDGGDGAFLLQDALKDQPEDVLLSPC